jgi:hypothetical protein
VENEGLDIGKVIGIIMENPQLIEQIANLAKQERPASVATDSPKDQSTVAEEKQAIAPTYTPPSRSINGSRRGQLFAALKPYVSEQRGRAIDSMMSIADILDVMRTK